MSLKYEENVKDCDLNGYIEHEDRIAFRYVFKDIEDERNFLPINVLNPENIEKFGCPGWALSFYSDLNKAKKRYSTILSDRPKAYKKLGTYLANGILQKADGISNKEEDSGHYSHYEYIDVELKSKFSIIDELKKI